MYTGLGILKAFSVTVRRFIESYIDDLKWFVKGGFGKRWSSEALAVRQSPKARGTFTVQYPREQLPLPERFRGFPFLVYEEEDGEKRPRCTACGMCSRVCPPQCIWIVRATDPETGKPKREPAEFCIDISICMNCGFCAEFCPFDAIKMGHEIEVATFEREEGLLLDTERLLKPLSYHAQIHPAEYAEEK
ncbi:MAG: 4Fe-4S binding protein [Anaerolineae bacterium]|jgi:NADH-quinone oxidoreductase subunit I